MGDEWLGFRVQGLDFFGYVITRDWTDPSDPMDIEKYKPQSTDYAVRTTEHGDRLSGSGKQGTNNMIQLYY
jgi:hypothetical protein